MCVRPVWFGALTTPSYDAPWSWDSTTGGLVHIDRLDVGRYEIPVKGAPSGADDGNAGLTGRSNAEA